MASNLDALKAQMGDYVSQLAAAAVMAEARAAANEQGSKRRSEWSKRSATNSATASATPKAAASTETGRTTIMLRNVPQSYSRTEMEQLLNVEGFAGTYDLLYFPYDFTTRMPVGYAFANFVTESEAARALEHFSGFARWKSTAEEMPCETMYTSAPQQGWAASIARYRNSPVMHPSVPEHMKPAVYEHGVQRAFPAPTKLIRSPRLSNWSRASFPNAPRPFFF